MSDAEAVAVNILDREFLVACTPEERPGLIAAAAHLDQKMREVRARTRGAGIERVAILTALNITHELLGLQRETGENAKRLAQQMQALHAKLEGAFALSLQ